MSPPPPSTDANRLRLVLSSVQVGLWEWDVTSDHVEWSEHVDHLFGLPPGVFGRTYDAFLATVHADDRELVTTTIGELVGGVREDYAMEHRIVWPGGSVHWIECKAHGLRDAAGQLVRIAGTVIDITSRKHAEAAVRASEELLRSAMDHSPIGMALVAPCGAFLDANPAFCSLVGYARDELLAADFQAITAPEDLEADLALVQEMLAGQRARYQLDKRYRHKQGHPIWAQLNVSLVRNPDGTPRYFVSQIQDIGERLASERALRASEEMLRQLAENLREVVWLRDLDEDRLLYLSPAYERVFRQPRAAFGDGSRAWLDAIHRDDRERVAAALADQGRAEKEAHFRFVEPDGTVRWIHARTFPIRDAAGRSYRVAGIAEDITERRRVEEQLHHAQKLDAFGQLAGGVAHDFNNLLAVILPHAEMAARTRDLAPRAAESLSAIREAAERAATLTRQLLQLGRRNVLQPRDLDLNEQVTRFARMLRRVLREDLRLEVQLAASELAVSVDTNMLDQVLMNLALNARDAMPDRGTLTIATSTVSLTEQEANAIEGGRAGHYACLDVIDTGDGIAADAQARLFEPFFTTKAPGKGTGLGLATVRGIVEQHRGTVVATSRPGHGATFRVLLPALARARAPAPAPAGKLARGGSETILVVEDEPAVRQTTVRTLEHHGYHVVPAVDGADALRLLDQRGAEIALVITDLVMPGTISGRELVVRLQARQPAIKLVLMSGYSPDIFGHELQLRGGDHFVPKPVSVDRLLDVVRTSLDVG